MHPYLARFSGRLTRWTGFRTALFWAIAVLSSAQFAFAYAALTPIVDLRDYAVGNVGFPFRRRLLMQYFYRWGFSLGDHLTFTSRRVHITPEVVMGVFVAFAACLLIILTARLFIAKLLGRQSLFVWFSLLTIYMTNYHQLQVHEIRVATPYDLTSTAFFGLACYAAFTRNRWLYYPVFIIATFNRESTLFLPLVFFIFGLREDLSLPQALKRCSPRLYLETTSQLVIWAIIFKFCERVTGGVPPTNPIFAYNLHLLGNPVHWATYASVFGFLWIPYLLFFDRIGNVLLKRVLWLAPFWTAVMLKYADPLEIRTNAEWTVYVTVCVTLIAHASWTLRDVPLSGFHPDFRNNGT